METKNAAETEDGTASQSSKSTSQNGENTLAKDYSSRTDPYSSSLAYFFKRVMPADIEQERLYTEYSDFPDLKDFIDKVIDKDGILQKFEVKEEKKDAYSLKKAELKNNGVRLP